MKIMQAHLKGLGLVLYTSEQKIIFIRADSSIGPFTQNVFRLVCWVKFSADNILKYFFYFSEKKEALAFHANFLIRSRFAGNVKTYFWGENENLRR